MAGQGQAKDSADPLTATAVALETELARYEHAVKELEMTAITSDKTLQRARSRLERCADMEARLGAALQSFAQAMQETQARQQRCMAAAAAVALSVQQRFDRRSALLERMKVLGERATEINEPVNAAMAVSESSPKLLSTLQAVGDLTASIIADASALQRAAKDDDWLDIERDTETLKQQLQTARNTVLLAQRSVAARAPS